VPDVAVVRGERRRRQLSLTRPSYEQVELDMISRGAGGEKRGVVPECVVRINFHCNQACTFCFVARQLPPPRHDWIQRAIVDAARRGDSVSLSGGEPTLHPRLLEYVRLASGASPHPVTLQTNAVRLDAALTAALVDAGLGHAFVSLHGATAETAEAITRAPGTFRRTLEGLDHLHRAKVPTTVNFVLCGANADEMTPALELVAARWRGARFNLSFVQASTDMVSRDRALIPRYRDVMRHVQDVFRAGRQRGVDVIGFESMCGLPLCVVPDGVGRELFDIPPEFESDDFVKTDACTRCVHDRRCWGIRRSYAELHGTAELLPVTS
jgi:MoaA/NifB/PqqE/SkfB family radical SAM enzyme